MKTVIVTGGGSGIGRATAKLFASKGERVIVADINLAAAESTVEQITAAGDRAITYRLDVADEQQWQDFGKWVLAEFGVAQVLVNNAGVMDFGGFVETSATHWQRTVDIDLMSVIYGSRIFGQQMVDAGVRGHIVNISSGAAYFPHQMVSAYGVAKAAALMATETLRVELRPHGIGVTAICPGVVRTNLVTNGVRVGLTDAEQANWKESAASVQAAGFATPEKLARVIERSVRRNWAVVPVNPESWLGYGLFRLSPSLMRVVPNIVSFDRADALLDKFRPILARLTK